jgi:hypothetical protein
VNEIDALTVGILRTVLAMAPGLPLVLALRLPLPKAADDWRRLGLSAAGGFVAFPCCSRSTSTARRQRTRR